MKKCHENWICTFHFVSDGLSIVKLQINVGVVPCIKIKGSLLTAKICIPLSICTKLFILSWDLKNRHLLNQWVIAATAVPSIGIAMKTNEAQLTLLKPLVMILLHIIIHTLWLHLHMSPPICYVPSSLASPFSTFQVLPPLT